MKKFLLACFMLAFALYSYGQERTVSGRVTSADDGSPLPGVNVVVKGTTIGTVTDANGSYSLNVTGSGQSFVFSFIGFQTMEVAVGDRTTVDVQLLADVRQLSEVIVTAQGIQREKKSLGYAATTVPSSDIVSKPETDVGRALQGRTPGLLVAQSSGMAGSGSKINIRGISSVSGDTQPLWIVDGIPINTSANENNTDFRDGQISPTRFIDIDPNNIESVNILRGLNATTLYGSLGRNGVIIITTKAGAAGKQKDKFEGSLNQSYYTVEAILPEFQNKWANGFDGDYGEFFSNWGRPFSVTTPPGSPHPYYEHRDLFPEFTEFNQPGNTAAAPNQATYVPIAYPDNINDFFDRGTAINTSLNLGMRTDVLSLNFNYSHLNEDGFIKNNKLIRDNFTIGGVANLTDKLTLNTAFNFIRTDTKSPPSGAGTGSNSTGGPSVWANLFYVPRNINLMGWPYQNPVTGASVFYRNGNDITNPRWLLYNAQQSSNTNRFFGNMSLSYQLLEWLNATYRLGVDTYTEDQKYWVNKGAVGFPTDVSFLNTGIYRSTTGTNIIFDHSALLGINAELSSDFDLTGTLGFNARMDEYRQIGSESTGQLVFGLIEHRNFVNKNDRSFRGIPLNYMQERTLLGAFFEAGLGYRDYLYLNISGRNDWASTHQEAHRSLFYPGVSASFVPSAAFGDDMPDFVDFLKLRIGYGTSARFADPYLTGPAFLRLNSNFTVDNTGNVPTLEIPALLVNPDLKPERQAELEVGLEAQFIDNRIGLDLSWYNRLAEDQILERPLDPSTGYMSTYINAGSISNKGIELALTLVPVKSSVIWNIRTNFTKNVSKVEKLPEGSKEIIISGFSDLGNFAIEGQPYGVIQGTFVERNENGEFIVNENGDWKVSRDIKVIGNPNPDWLASVLSDISYKGFRFGFQWDYVHGGDVFSYSAATLVGRGVSKDLEDFDPTLPLILPGVKESDGSANDIPITTSGMFFGNTIIGGGASDRGIFDATRIRLREVSLSYSLPNSLIANTPIKGISISLIGQNLWYRAFNTPKYSRADLDRTAFGTNNGSGFDFLGGPSARRYGATLRLNF